MTRRISDTENMTEDDSIARRAHLLQEMYTAHPVTNTRGLPYRP